MNTLEKKFLEHLVNENQPVFMYLVNGVRLDGHLLAFDAMTFILASKAESTNPLLVYRSMVATVQQAPLFSKNHFRRGISNRPPSLKQVETDGSPAEKSNEFSQ